MKATIGSSQNSEGRAAPARGALSGKTVLITGANKGLGLAAATGLARDGARVLLACRSRERGEAALATLRAACPDAEAELELVDLASLSSVRALAERVAGRLSRLDVLINNASLIPRQRELTQDGFEMQFGVSHLAHFLLTRLLEDLLRESAPSRVVTVSSMAHAGVRLDFDDLQAEAGYDPTVCYRKAKLANVLFALELARRQEGNGVTSNCLHPGIVDTDLLRDFGFGPTALRRWISRIFGSRADESAGTILHVASAPELEDVTGAYFVRKRQRAPSAAGRDPEAAARLWDVSSDLTSLPPS